MILVLPVNTTLSSVLHAMSETPITSIVESLRKSREDFGDSEVIVRLPKFKISTQLKMIDILKQIGIHDLFDDAANLSGISPSDLFVSNVIQHTNIEIDENGTEASSATIIDIANKGGQTIFEANKPFAFFVIEKQTQTLLFMGKVYSPLGV